MPRPAVGDLTDLSVMGSPGPVLMFSPKVVAPPSTGGGATMTEYVEAGYVTLGYVESESEDILPPGAEYVEAGYVDPGYVESEAAPVLPPVVVLDFDIDVGAPTLARHRTALASRHAVEMAYWGADSPWAPFDAQPLFAAWNHIGIYCWGREMPPEAIRAAVFRADNTLVDLGPVHFQSVPSGSFLLGSITDGRRPTGVAVVDNSTGWFFPLMDEIWLGMGAGSFVTVRGLWTAPVLTGTLGRIRVARGTVEFHYGDFRRDSGRKR